MATQPTRLTWDDLLRMPETVQRQEIIDGELFVTPSPLERHQWVVTCMSAAFLKVVGDLGGRVYGSPLDVVFDQRNVVEPDGMVFLPEHLDRIRGGYPRAAPDLAVEVSSPSTKGRDRIVKRALYERFGVAEYWIVDLDDEVIEVYALRGGRYHRPLRFVRGDVVRSEVLVGFAADFDDLVPGGVPGS